ncbi:MAG TPA: DUF1573 domain-containing protein [Bacteroidales bacterium]|nr:DUF1573 domain-containing protein [Bacteroidales bacterium]
MHRTLIGMIAAGSILMPALTMGQQTTSDIPGYPHKIGHLYFSSNFMNFNYLKDTEDRLDTLKLFNAWDRPMEVVPEKPPKHMECTVLPQPIPPGSEGLLVIKYYGTARPDYGFIGYRLGLRTNDTEQLIKTLPVNAYIEEDFSRLTDEEQANPPKLEILGDRYNFGTVKEGVKVSHEYVVKNSGTRELIIRSTRASCGCTAIKPDKTVLLPGEESKIAVELDTQGRKGIQHKTVTIITNDPKSSTSVIHIEGTVE